MMKRKFATVCVTLLLLSLAFGLTQPVKASSNNTWSVNWHDHIDYDYSPINLSSTIEVSGADGHCTDIVELVVTIAEYDYDPFVEMDFVYFRVVVYVKSIADPGYQPQYATQVSIQLKKIYDDPEHTIITLVDDVLPPGYSQGEGLVHKTPISSTYSQRETLSLKALAFAVGLACEPVDIAMDLIEFAEAFSSSEGENFQNAEYGDTFAYSWWDNPGYHWTESPVRQYCFNCFHWFQDNDTCPSGEYGLKIWATVNTHNPAVIPPITAPPIYLVIHGPRTLTITTNGYGSTDPAPETYTCDYGEFVTVTAAAGFTCWLLDGVTFLDNPITVTMDSDRTLKAYFESSSGGGGGGADPGCPTLFVWDGTAYGEEGILDIHAYSDVTVHHEIENTLALDKGVYKLQLRELDNHTSHIDQVKLYAVDYEGEWHLCPLIYACHSELGKVKHTLRFDDENRVDLKPTEMIDLQFALSTPYGETAYFIFEINGYNYKGPTMK